MKNKCLKKRHRLHIVIMSALIVFCLLFMSLFTIITYNSTKEKCMLNCYFECNNIISDIKNDINYGTFSSSYAIYSVNTISTENNMSVRVYKNNNCICETGNYLPVIYYDKEKIFSCSYIDFNLFRASINDKQYKKIQNYLDMPKDKDGRYYELCCTKYYDTDYYDNVGILPKEITIVKTCDNYTWYTQTDKVESFDLSPEISDKYKNITPLCEIGEMHINKIEKDFFSGKYERDFTIDDVENLINGEDFFVGYNDYGIKCIELDLFNCLIANKEAYVNWIYAEDEADDTYSDENSYDSKIYYTTDNYYNIICAKRFNILDYCIDTIITGWLIIFFLFAIIAVLETAMWRISKTRALQEQSRIDMVNSVAHNLKTPLFVISGFAENLKKETDDEKRRHFIDVVQQQTVDMNKLIHRMIDMSKLSSPQINLNKEKLCFNSFITDLIDDYRQCTENEIIIKCDQDAEINADISVLKTAIDNLVDNAIKYSDIKSDIVIEISNGCFRISNKCKEYSEEELKSLWQPYHRHIEGDNTSGNGIGLTTVKAAFELHKFKYGVDYSDGIICFWFKF